ncbi:MAG TPA: tRNA lysidine(34) synthetase TilS, partial [Tepidiformaceae bacterium]|nr:tRNA lysidine(34) synthetase TilS [Tepidiformaceae bacterium]
MGALKGTRTRLVIFACLVITGYFAYTAATGWIRNQQLAEDRAAAEERVRELEATQAYLEAAKERSPLSSQAHRPRRERNEAGPGGSGSSRGKPSVESIVRQVGEFATRERMFRRVQRVLVAVSGGPDSVACLELLLRLRDQFGFEVCAAHFDHQLRDGSAEDLAWVRDFAKGHGLECLTGEGPVADVARKQGRGIEETARMMRYQFLAFAAEKLNADCIATGHTRDDQAETVLMHIARGSGVRGVRGMLPVAGVPGATERRLVRPLLETSRTETLATCAELGIAPRVDATNSDPSATRNRVRHETLEALRALNPGVTGALVGLAESAREAFAFIEKRSYETQPLERGPVGSIFALSALSALPGEALSLVLEREASFYHLEPEVNRTRIENARAVLARGSGSVRFGSVEMEASVGKVRVGPLLEEVEPLPVAVLNV